MDIAKSEHKKRSGKGRSSGYIYESGNSRADTTFLVINIEIIS